MVILHAIVATMATNFLVNFLPFGRAAIRVIRLVVIATGLGIAYRYGVVQ
jgi:hypothetical protein